jgi:multiple sugar transport system permease protein
MAAETEVRPPAATPEASGPAPRRRRRHRVNPWHFLLMPVALVFLFPLIQLVMTSLESDSDINKFPPRFFPSHLTLNGCPCQGEIEGFIGLFQGSDILRWLLNTVIVATVAVVSHLVLCSLAGYGFARLKFAGRTLTFFAIVGTIMIPTQLLMIPTYVMFSRLGVINTLSAAAIPWLASAFGVFLMRQFFLSLPKELEEAARLDGCSPYGVFWRIVLPLARPALATLSIFTLLSAWNDLIWPLIAISNHNDYTLQLGLSQFLGTRRTQWSLLMAGNVVATMPLIGFFLVAQKQFVATMTFSGLKG